MSNETTPVAVPVAAEEKTSLTKKLRSWGTVKNGLLSLIAIIGLLNIAPPVKGLFTESTLSASEAAGKVGQKATVEMLVGSEKYFLFGKSHNLNDGQWPNQTFTIRVTGAVSPVAQKGQTVRATGVVQMYNNKPQLVVKAEDVKIVK